jgi:hydroxyacylglutathione hydrolase
VHVEVIPVLEDNYAFLVVCEETGEAAVVDPADARPVLEAARRAGARLVAAWCTHHHGDHTAGLEELATAHPGLRILAHRLDGDRIPGCTVGLEDGETVRVGRIEARVLHTPGHTRGGACYLAGGAGPAEEPAALFTGDTLFAAGCGRLFEGDAGTLHASLRRIAELPGETRIYCGHEYALKNLAFAATVEPESEALRERTERARCERAAGRPFLPLLLAEELATNPFLRCEEAAIRDRLRARDPGAPEGGPVQVFAQLRALRNRY